MPGVLVVEAMAQAGGVLLLTEFPDRAEKLLLFTGIERARFRRPVGPATSFASRWTCWRGAAPPAACKARRTWATSWPARRSSPAGC